MRRDWRRQRPREKSWRERKRKRLRERNKWRRRRPESKLEISLLHKEQLLPSKEQRRALMMIQMIQ